MKRISYLGGPAFPPSSRPEPTSSGLSESSSGLVGSIPQISALIPSSSFTTLAMVNVGVPREPPETQMSGDRDRDRAGLVELWVVSEEAEDTAVVTPKTL